MKMSFSLGNIQILRNSLRGRGGGVTTSSLLVDRPNADRLERRTLVPICQDKKPSAIQCSNCAIRASLNNKY